MDEEDEFFYGDHDLEENDQRPRSHKELLLEECRSKGEVDKEAIAAINAEGEAAARRRRFQQRKLGSFHYVAMEEGSDG